MLNQSRAIAWERLAQPFDLLVIGGGVTGAGILFEAARRGLRAALVERDDFASGTSSRSSKLVHGGLRYLKEGRIGLTREAVRERQELLRGAPGLVDPMPFILPHYRHRKPGRTSIAAGLALYDLLARARQHRYVDRDGALGLVHSLDPTELTGAHVYVDATTDDARLVLRLLQEAIAAGATACNYAEARLLFASNGNVRGARLLDRVEQRSIDIETRAVVNATGVFADDLRAGLGASPRLRPLRGSHLVVADWRLPLAFAVAFEHPQDARPVFAYPWLGRTLVGTTDLDHDRPLADEPSIAPAEVDYLIAALRFQFPAARVDASDVVATFSGIRPIVADDAGMPSRASRDHAVWEERGLVTINGGKLTTFRPMALDALAAAAPYLPVFDRTPRPIFAPAALPNAPQLGATARQRLAGRYGALASTLVEDALPEELEPVGATETLWSELRFAARRESVVHLDDLLLRRTRLGLLLEGGGAHYFERIAPICCGELGWDEARWNDEVAAYRRHWNAHYAVPVA